MVSDQTIDTDTWTAVRTILVDADIKVGTTEASINAIYNDKKDRTPQIIIHPMEDDEVLDKFSSNQGRKVINVIIDCVFTNTLGADQLNQQVKHALKSNQISGMELIGVVSNINFDEANQAKYQMKSTTFTYLRE